jgi:hypothetical protein
LTGVGAENVIIIFNTISQTKTSVWGLNRAYVSLFEASKKGSVKGMKRLLHKVMG